MKRGYTEGLKVMCLVILISFMGCEKQDIAGLPAGDLQKPVKPYATINNLSDFVTDTAIWIRDGQSIMVTRSDDEEMEEEVEASENRAAACTNIYDGVARANAKTTFATPAIVKYSTIPALRSSLQTDTYMRSIGLTSNSLRFSQEQRNVSVTTSYLYAIKMEDDEDYHLIIGNNTDSSGLMNCEASGLPPVTYSSYAAIAGVRNAIKNYFGTDFCGEWSYTKFTPAIKISILKGSMFYDIDHLPGVVGPTGLRPNTSWEMHPIGKLRF